MIKEREKEMIDKRELCGTCVYRSDNEKCGDNEVVCAFENSAWCGDVRDYEDSCELWDGEQA